MFRNASLWLTLVVFFMLLLYFKYFRRERENIDTSFLSHNFANPNNVLAKGKKIMLLAPHEDDEALMCTGIITHALANGADLRVVVVTNGDNKGCKAGFIRLRETIKAMEYLGLNSENIVLLGYGDTSKNSDSFLNRLYNASNDKITIKSKVGSETYSIPEMPEFHYQKYGVHAAYDRATFRQDMKMVIEEFNPDSIFVSSFYDTHPDHSMLYRFTVESIIDIKRNNTKFSPIMYEYIIHSHDGDDSWPERNQKGGPLVPFSKPVTLEKETLLDWEQREIFTLPLKMQTRPLSKNKKYITIGKYRSQRPKSNNNYLYSYVKLDEFFWKKDFSNIAFLANVSVSSENTLTNQLGIKAVDGFIDGYPHFPDHEWVAKGETAGAWIQLSWSQAYTINKIVLYGRPNLHDIITSATLSFSDGSSIHIDDLPDNGKGYEINFIAKTVEWIKFTVNTVVGESTGLSEFEVYEEPSI